jgi:alpha-tubulin suppressor-like RCC1 family protein
VAGRLDGIHVASVAAVSFHALALTRCGKVYSWGNGGLDCIRQLGLGDGDGSDTDHVDCSSPQLITALLGKRERAVAAGRYTSVAMTDTGALYTWGRSRSGNLGHGDLRDRNVPTLVQGLNGIRVVAVSAHEQHTLALTAVGSVYAFGKGAGLGSSSASVDEDGEGARWTHIPHKIPGLVCTVS